MEWEWRVGRRKEQNYTPEHRVRKRLSSCPFCRSPTRTAIITTQWAGTKGKPKRGFQRGFWPEILHMWIYFFKSFIKMLPSSKKAGIIVTILKSIRNRLSKLSRGWEVHGLLVLPYWLSFDFLKYTSIVKVDFKKCSSYSSFLFWSFIWYIKVYSILFKWQNGAVWLGWPTGTRAWKLQGRERAASLLIPLRCSLPCVYDILKVTGDSLQLFLKTNTITQRFQNYFENCFLELMHLRLSTSKNKH